MEKIESKGIVERDMGRERKRGRKRETEGRRERKRE